MSAEQNASFLAFVAWAAGKGYDTAHTYDTDRSVWIALNPMAADLWSAWQASRTAAQAQIASLEAARDAAFAMSRCECSSEEACANLVKMRAERDTLLEAARKVVDARNNLGWCTEVDRAIEALAEVLARLETRASSEGSTKP